MSSYHLLTYFLLSGVLHGFYLCIILITSKSSNTHGRLLSIVIGAFTIYLFNVWILRSGFEVLNEYLSATSLPFLYLAGPSYWLYLQFTVGAKNRWIKLDFIHLLPAVICFMAASPYYLMDCQVKLQDIAILKNSSIDLSVKQGFYFGGHIVQTLFYLFLSFKTIDLFKKSVKRKTKEFRIMQSWVSEIYVTMIALTAIYLISFIGFIFFSGFRWVFDNMFDFSLAAFIHLVGSLIIMKSPILAGIGTNASETPFVQDTEDTELRKRILGLMESKPFLDSNYTLRTFSHQLGTNTVYASKMVNLLFDKSFSEFINELRVEEAKLRLKTKSDDKLFAIALESGFSNKQTFARVFKKYTGLNPSEYREKLKKLATIN